MTSAWVGGLNWGLLLACLRLLESALGFCVFKCLSKKSNAFLPAKRDGRIYALGNARRFEHGIGPARGDPGQLFLGWRPVGSLPRRKNTSC